MPSQWGVSRSILFGQEDFPRMSRTATSHSPAAGFTLIELMIVIAIIAVIAAIAIPNLLEARKGANETSAIGLLRAVHTANSMFKDRDYDKNGVHDYAREGGDLRGLVSVAGPDDRVHAGYIWGLLDDPAESATVSFMAIAAPLAPMRSGDRVFTIDESGVIRFLSAEGFDPAAFEINYVLLRQWRTIQ